VGDEFFADRPEQAIALPTGQAFVTSLNRAYLFALNREHLAAQAVLILPSNQLVEFAATVLRR
jgi:hypothetical protein